MTMVRGVSGNYELHMDPRTADCVLGLGFGLRETAGNFQPGAGNEALAAYYHQSFPNLPVLMQDDLLEAVISTQLHYGPLHTIEQFATLGDRMTTYRLMKLMQRSMSAKGYERPVLLAASHQVPRAVAIAKKLGLELIVPYGLPDGFDPKSSQRWTRNAWRWAFKEPFVMIQHRLFGWI